LINDYLGYLVDRAYSPHSVEAYAFDLLTFARWLESEHLALETVTTDSLVRYLAACRAAPVRSRPGGNVYSIRDGRNAGFAPSTINRRLAAISGLFSYRQMLDPSARSPVPASHGASIRPRTRLLGRVLGHTIARRRPAVKNSPEQGLCGGGPGRDRTCDRRIMSRGRKPSLPRAEVADVALSQVVWGKRSAGVDGLQPACDALQTNCWDALANCWDALDASSRPLAARSLSAATWALSGGREAGDC
jgi:Phage integrase, N-terminal SAM-like domain